MCNVEEDFCGTAKCKRKYTNVDKYIIGTCLLALTMAVIFMGICLYQTIISL
jgi:hypothetical protein